METYFHSTPDELILYEIVKYLDEDIFNFLSICNTRITKQYMILHYNQWYQYACKADITDDKLINVIYYKVTFDNKLKEHVQKCDEYKRESGKSHITADGFVEKAYMNLAENADMEPEQYAIKFISYNEEYDINDFYKCYLVKMNVYNRVHLLKSIVSSESKIRRRSSISSEAENQRFSINSTTGDNVYKLLSNDIVDFYHEYQNIYNDYGDYYMGVYMTNKRLQSCEHALSQLRIIKKYIETGELEIIKLEDYYLLNKGYEIRYCLCMHYIESSNKGLLEYNHEYAKSLCEINKF